MDVIASFAGMELGQSEIETHENLNIRRVEDIQDVICRKLKGRLKTVLERVFKALLWPDEYVAWALRILLMVKPNAYDRIILCVRPESLLLFAWLKGVSDKWIVDCQESFLPDRVRLRRSPIQHLLLHPFVGLQKKVFKKSGKVLFTSESSRKEYIRQGIIAAEKSKYLSLFYDDTVHDKNELSVPLEKFIIEYPGRFGRIWGRTPEPFLKALSLFLSRNPAARELILFRFHGPWYEDHTPLIRELGLNDIVEIHPSVPYKDYLKLLRSASAFLLVAAKEDNLFVPAKMMDFFAVGRPILAFVPMDSETYMILRNARMDKYTSHEENVEQGARNIQMLWERWHAGEADSCLSQVEQWAWSAQKSSIIRMMELENVELQCRKD